MSIAISEGINPRLLMDPFEACERYKLETREPSLFASELERDLITQKVGRVAMPVSHPDFEHVLASFETCIEEVPELMRQTSYVVDIRLGGDAGYVRKELKEKDGRQIDDPKSLFHFNEAANQRWVEEFAHAPQILREFLRDGRELQQELLVVSRNAVLELEDTHPNITKAHFPGPPDAFTSYSFLRILSYDDYEATAEMPDVAKAHFDISHFTIQAYADAPGFWGSNGPHQERLYYDTLPGEAYMFAGRGYSKLYNDKGPIMPLYHGVSRQAAAVGEYIPRRHAVILFTNAPYIDPNVTHQDTIPELF